MGLLDGSSLESSFSPTSVQHSFWYNNQALGEERLVAVAQTSPTAAASHESAEIETVHSDVVSLWTADREGHPVFVTVRSGSWVALLHLGYGAAQSAASLPDGLISDLALAADDHGVALVNFTPTEFRTFLERDANTVELAVGSCRGELVAGSETVGHPDRGEVVRAEGYASWCQLDDGFEVMVYGEEGFVDEAVNTLVLMRQQS